MRHRYEGRSPADIALGQAAMYEKFVRQCEAELQETQSPRFVHKHGRLPAEEARLRRDIDKYKKAAEDAMAKALAYEERYR
jgi:hypothetical protein